MLSGLPPVVQATILDCLFFDASSPFLDGGVATKVDVGGRDVAEAFVIALVIVVLDEFADLVFQMPRQIIVLQQDAVFQGLVPPLDFALRLWVIDVTPIQQWASSKIDQIKNTNLPEYDIDRFWLALYQSYFEGVIDTPPYSNANDNKIFEILKAENVSFVNWEHEDFERLSKWANSIFGL